MTQTLEFLWLQVCRIITFSPFHSAGKPLTDTKRLFLTFTLLLIPATVLAQEITWTGGGDGISWSDPANWNDNRTPGQEDDVVINLDGTYTIEKSGNITMNSLTFTADTGEQTFRNINGDITLLNASSLGSSVTLIMEAGYIRGDGTLTNNGIIQANSSSWSGINNSSLINNGLIQQISGILYVSNSAIIENYGSIHITDDINITNSGALGAIINHGTLAKTGGTGISNITVPIDSRPDSRIESETGTLELRQNSSYHNTTFAANTENATLRLQGGAHTLRGLIDGEPVGSIVVNAPLEAHESGAILSFGGSGLRWISSYFQGGNTLTNTGLIYLNASSWTGVSSSTLINDGVMIHQAGIFYTSNSGVLDNRGIYRFVSDVNIITSGALSTFINSGVIEKTGGDAISNITAFVDARAGSRVESQIGSIHISQNSTWHNTEFAATTEQSSIQLNSGRHTFRGTISGEPVGEVRINTEIEAYESGATVDFGGSGLMWISNYLRGGQTLTNEGLIIMDASSWTGINGATIVNNGEMLHRGGIFYLANSAVLNNQQLYRFESDQNITTSGSLSTFINHGVIEKTVGDGVSTITASVDSRPDSRIESRSGSIWISQNSIYQEMTITAAANAEVRFQSGTQTFRGTIEGAPEGQVTINTSIQADEELDATLNFTENGLTWISNYLIEGGTLTNTGLISLSASSWTGLNNSQVINEGTIRHLDGIFYLTNGSEFINNDQYVVLGDESIRRSGSMGSFVNNGTFMKESGGTFIISTIYHNSSSGTLDLQSGELQLQQDSFFETPTVRVGGETELTFQSGTHTFSGMFSPVNEGVITLNSNFRADPGGATINIPEPGLNWTGGYLSEGTLTNTGTIRVSGSGAFGVNKATLQNSGNITLESGNFRLLSSGELRNIAEFIVDGDVNFFTSTQIPGVFTNSGLFHKKGGSGISTIYSEFVNSEFGEVRFEAGETRFTSLLDHQESALITGTGRFDIARADFINKGITRPGLAEGVLTFLGDYEPNDTTAVLDVLLYEMEDSETEELVPASTRIEINQTEYNIGFIRPGGNAILAGEINVKTGNNYIPDEDTEFEILRASRSISGGFTTLSSLVDVVNMVSYYPVLRDTSLLLIAKDGVPTLSGEINADPEFIQAGRTETITLTGSGFAPDISVSLTCEDCGEGDPISGQIQAVLPDSVVVSFNLSAELNPGTYDLTVSDPRGGQASTPIQMDEADVELSVHVLKESTQGDDNTGLFVIRSNRTLQTNLTVPYQLSGSAQQYVHYVTDLLGGSVTLPAGTDSLVVSILPLTFEGSARSVGFQIQYENQPPAVSNLSAFMTINSSSENIPFQVLNFTPDQGGNVGIVTMTVTGSGFTETSSISLSGGLSAQNISINETGTKMTGILNLIGQTTGLQDLTISNGSDEETLNSAFRVESGIYPEVYVQVFAPVRVPRIRQRTYTIILQNQGNVDVRGYAAIGGLPANAVWSIDDSEFGIDTGAGFEWKDIAPVTQIGETIQISFPYINLGAGETRKIDLTTSVPTAQTMELIAAWFYN